MPDSVGQSPLPLMADWFDKQDTPDLRKWDVILLNTSGGKDSQAMIAEVVRQADLQDIDRSRLVAVHADLGRVEWNGTRELAAEQVAAYGIEFRVVSRPQGDLLDHVESRGMWPGPATRYCTSDHKRGQISKAVTALDRERRTGDTFRLLNCMGLRAQESAARRKKQALSPNGAFSTQTREVWDWLPIHRWSEDRVWATIAESGIRYHHAYDIGMPRLSCVFCIYAPREALVLAGRHNPDLLDLYVGVEQRIGHAFKPNLSLEEVRLEAAAGESTGPITGQWNM